MSGIVERLHYHHEHPVTGKLVLRNLDGPEAADSITDLLEALHVALGALEFEGVCGGDCNACDMARAAIAKAKGGAS